jgi:hypothetical protein
MVSWLKDHTRLALYWSFYLKNMGLIKLRVLEDSHFTLDLLISLSLFLHIRVHQRNFPVPMLPLEET